MKTKSFTLIELLVVIVIIGILAGVIIISTSSSISKANFAKAQAFSNTVQQELLLDISHGYSFNDINTTINQPIPNGTLIINDWGVVSLNVENGPILRSGKDCFFGKCLDFINDSATNLNRIYIDDSFDFSSSNFTISYWANIRGGCRYYNSTYYNSYNMGIMEIIDSSTGNTIIYQGLGNNKPKIYLHFTDMTSVILDIDNNKNMYNNWKLITYSYNDKNDTLKFYIDGEIIYDLEVGSLKNLRTSNNAKISIGKFTTYWMKGIIDEFKIYQKEISVSQIQQNYITGLNSLLANNNISKEEYDQRLNNLAYDKE